MGRQGPVLGCEMLGCRQKAEARTRAWLTWTASTKSLMPLRSSRRPKKATRQTGFSTRSLGAWSRSAIILGTGSLRQAGN